MAATTRLDRLVSLLDTGTSPLVKGTAARQLGQIASQRVRGSQQAERPPIAALSNVKQEPDTNDSSEKAATSADLVGEIYRGTHGQWEEALNLCARVVPFLHSRSWDTREAAALAIESICRGSGIWDQSVDAEYTTASSSKLDQADDVLQPSSQDDFLSFDSFELTTVLSKGVKLLSSTGKEYDIFDAKGGSVADRLAAAKSDMARLVGLQEGDLDLGLDVEEELKQGEIKTESKTDSRISSAPSTPGPAKKIKEEGGSRLVPPQPEVKVASGSTTPAGGDEIDLSKLSARERNQLKRKRKMGDKSTSNSMLDSKTRVVEGSNVSSPGNAVSAATGLRIKNPGSDATPQDYLEAGDNIRSQQPSGQPTPADSPKGLSPPIAKAPTASLAAPAGEWPFSHLTSLLLLDIFSPRWETRHGASLALRSIFSLQGGAGGMSLLATSANDNEQRHTKWVEDAAVKLICLLSLDRLSDFVFDQVVAPVREVGAQALSALLPHMDNASVLQMQEVLLEMAKQSHVVPEKEQGRTGRRGDAGYAWEVRHAGLSGLRWLIEARLIKTEGQEQDYAVYSDIVDTAMSCLRDSDDDIRAVASSVLLPLAGDVLVNGLPQKLPSLLDTLWDCLKDLKDDLNSSTGSVMDLLATLLRHQSVIDLVQSSIQPLATLIPLIYPFFRHTITSVRLSVLNTLQVFLDSLSGASGDWLDDRVFRLLFQNLIVEEKLHIRKASSTAWLTAVRVAQATEGKLETLLSPHVPAFLKMLMTPLGTPFDFSLFYNAATSSANDAGKYNIDKSILNQDLSLIGVDVVIRGRLGAAEALGAAAVQLWRQADPNQVQHLLPYLDSASALQRCLAATVAQEWAESCERAGQTVDGLSATEAISSRLLALVNAPPPPTWNEMGVRLSRIQLDCSALLRAFQNEGKVPKAKIPSLPSTVDPLGLQKDAFNPDMAERVVTKDYEALLALVTPKQRKAALTILEDCRRKVIAGVGFYRDAKDKQDTQVFAAAAAALISLHTLPAKLNPIIRSIMNSVKFEENADLQQRSAKGVASFVALCRSPGAKADPSPKIVKNLCAFICQDTTQTAIFANVKGTHVGIMSQGIEATANGSTGGKRSAAPAADSESEEVRQGKLIRRGAEMALGELSKMFGKTLFEFAPALWEGMSATLVEVFANGLATADAAIAESAERGQGVLDCCTLIEVVSHHLASDHQARVETLLSPLGLALQSRFAAVRSAAANCLSGLADSSMAQTTMIFVVRELVPLLSDASSVTNRQGAVELINSVVSRLDLKLLPYVIVLVVPLLGRMSDSDDQIRLMATNTFAALIKMVPLEAALPDPPGFPDDMLKKRDQERQFLSQLLDGSKVEPYEMPVKINADLRKYQREGISWMNFLAKFQLHGVLCDDMGLGKTLQSICILSAKHHERDERYRSTGSVGSAPLPSLVVCPPTLTGHWHHEIKQYATNLRPMLYTGPVAARLAAKADISKHDVIVTSYDVVRNDIALLSTFNWNYCILDEGHIIKSAKTKTTKAVKMIKANHRLILSGTPIQNNVLELWSLFDFLMPGFLGTERSFHERFGRPILATREGKASAKEQEAAALALESLHKQVLPFLLRRLKDDVLDDLPPKIIQDVECELGAVQKQLYDDYQKRQGLDQNLDNLLEGEEAPESNGEAAPQQQHVFQTLQYLRKLVNHPALVFDPSNAKHKEIESQLVKSGGSLRDIAHAPKLETLMQLLQSCGIGVSSTNEGEAAANAIEEGAVSQHRVLIFCQMKQMLDIIEKDLFKSLMPSVSYMRLDGSVPSERRHGIVQTFNADPSIDVLLLTTQVGGLGLTLTGADTVIFVEHDWNPMKDLQAMDRAHRLGQKKVVNVYRLITRDTLEQRIMGLQQFKLNVANTIISQQNAGLDSMATDQVLDLFADGPGGAAAGKEKVSGGAREGLIEAAMAAGGKKLSQKALLANLQAMGDTGEDYESMGSWRPS